MIQRKAFLSILSIIMLFCSFHSVHAEEIKFQDVSADHWAIDTIQWAVKEKIVDGYPDHTFKPENGVGQKEFITMLIRAFNPADFNDKKAENEEWYSPYIDYAFSYGWYVIIPFPTSGSLNASLNSDIHLSRGQAAKIIADATGKNYNHPDSIRYLLDNNIVEGKVDNSFSGFKDSDPLTRAEALTMIKHVRSKLDKLQKSPHEPEKYEPKPEK